VITGKVARRGASRVDVESHACAESAGNNRCNRYDRATSPGSTAKHWAAGSAERFANYAEEERGTRFDDRMSRRYVLSAPSLFFKAVPS